LTCETCGTSVQRYKSQVKKHVYCSKECADKGKVGKPLNHGLKGEKHPQYRGVLVETDCLVCGARFKKKVRDQVTCSIECGIKYKQSKKHYTSTKCETCGKEFRYSPSRKRRFCSRNCYVKSRVGKPRSHDMSGENNPRWKGIRIYVPCEHCGELFLRTSLTRKYCSTECASKEHGAKVSGEKNPNYVDFVSKTCEFCGNEFKVKPGKAFRKYCSIQCSNQGLLLGHETSLEKAVREQLELLGINFIPQHPFDLYTVDFLLPDYNVVIECDGEYWHSKPHQKNRDRRKDAYLRRLGYTVIRLTESEIENDVHKCVVSALQEVGAIGG
jgi:very-short-patch-repair endonuclease